jgi:MoxR-like ATPase
MARYIAAKRGQPFFRINLDGGAAVDQILGKLIPREGSVIWSDGDLIKAMRIGGLVCLDEISAARPEMLFALYSLLDDDHFIVLKDKEDGEVVIPHPDFRLIATTNPRHGAVSYAGVKELNKALKDRFVCIIVNYMSPSDEIAYVSSVTDTPVEIVSELVDLANKVRTREINIYTTFSTRLILDLAEWSHEMPIYDAACVLLPGNMGQEEASKILKRMQVIPALSTLSNSGAKRGAKWSQI